MTPGRVGGADRVDCREALRVPQGLEHGQAGVQTEIPVQVEDVLLGYGDATPLPIIDGVPMRDNHVEPVHGTALEETYQNAAVSYTGGRADREGSSGEE